MQDKQFIAALALLSEGLNLCVRGRKLDALVKPFNPGGAGRETICNAPQLWVVEQYETDLADWERRARAFASQHMEPI